MATLLLIYVQRWWAMFGLRNVQSWTFAAFAVVLLQTVLEYLLAALLVPVVAGEVDMRSEYYSPSRWFFGAFFLVLAASLLKDVVLGGTLPTGLNLAFHLVQMAICLAAMAIRTE